MIDDEHSKADELFVSRSTSWGLKKHLRNPFTATILILLLLGIGFSGWHYALQLRDQRVVETQNQDNEIFKATMRRVSYLRSQKKYADAIKEADGYITIGSNKINVATMMASKGATYEVQKDNKTALSVYREAETKAEKDMYGIDNGIARTSQALGDNKTALTYYKKCITVLQEDGKSGAKAMEIDYLQRIVKSIEDAGVQE